MMHISYSRISTYCSCPYRHYLRYVKRLEKRRPSRPLFFGTDFHKLLELRNDKKALRKAKSQIEDTYYDMPASWQADLGENYPKDLFTIFKDYQTLYGDQPQPQVTEQDFELEVGSCKGEPIIFVGKIDELYLRKRHGERYIMIGEHKTFSQKPSMNTLVMNTQKSLYAKATQMLRGILPTKVKWDYIKSTPAESPVWLEKQQRFSNAQSKKITPMSWERACKAMKILDPSVISQGERFRHNIQEFFFQMTLDIDPVIVEDVWDGYLFKSKQLIRDGEKDRTKNMTRDCSWCDFHDICYAEVTGGDVDYVIQKDYKERE